MRKKIVIVASAGVLALSGVAVAVPALADTNSTAAAGASAVDRITDALTGLVTDGSITQEQADEVATTLGEAGIGGRGGHGGPGGRLDLSVAATALELTEEELRTALEADGASLASVAEAQGVAVEDLVTALSDAEEERIARAVTDGRLTQEQADQRLADLDDRIGERVDATGADRPGRGGHGDRPGEPTEVPAD